MTYVAPNSSYLIVRDCSGGNKAYLRRAYNTIKRLCLEFRANKWVVFTYKRGRRTDDMQIERVERDISHDVRKRKLMERMV